MAPEQSNKAIRKMIEDAERNEMIKVMRITRDSQPQAKKQAELMEGLYLRAYKAYISQGGLIV